MINARCAKTIVVTIAIAAGVLAPDAARAQDRQFHFNVGGGPTFTLGDLSERFAIGWGPSFGGAFDLTDRLTFQIEYAYRFFNFDDNDQAGVLSAEHSVHQLDFNVMRSLTSHDSGRVHTYVAAGPGLYYRNVAITRYDGSGFVCDPFLYICGTYPVESILARRGGWDFGINLGGGVGMRFEDLELYIESRYHYVWGPDIRLAGTLPAGGTASQGNANGSYWPLTFGFRF